MNSSQPRIARTKTGYRFNNLEATGLPPRASQALLLSAADFTAKEAASVMGCSHKNIDCLLSTLRFKTKTNHKAGLITEAFRNGWLRVAAATFLISIVLSQSIMIQEHQIIRPRTTKTTRKNKNEKSSNKNGNFFEAIA